MTEEERSLPSVILPPSYNFKGVDEPVGVEIALHRGFVFPRISTETREFRGPEFFSWLPGKTAFCSLEERGVFDTVFKYLEPSLLPTLAVQGSVQVGDVIVYVYGRDGCIVVRRGNEWGSLSNITKLFPKARTAKQARMSAELGLRKMSKYGWSYVNFRSVGRVAQDLVLGNVKWQPKPPPEHMLMHLQAFKGARMEGVTFGASNVYDYDIKSAFPSYVSDLTSTVGMRWVESDEIIEDAPYAAVLCDLNISDRLLRGPVAVRDGDHALYFPVGQIEGVWINKPEIDLLLEYPEIGRITKVHRGSWGLTGNLTKPFARLVRKLFIARANDEFLADYLKYVMAAIWGKFISVSTYVKDMETGEGWTQASPLYNPVFAAHVTSAMRCNLYRRSMGLDVVGEFIDGLTVTRPLDLTGNSIGELVEKGRGTLVLFNDQTKGASWKNPDILGFARSQKDQHSLNVPFEFYHTLKSAYNYFGPRKMSAYLGKVLSTTRHVRLGSSMRFMGDKPVRVGDLLESTVRSWPPHYGEMKFFRLLYGLQKKEDQQPFDDDIMLASEV